MPDIVLTTLNAKFIHAAFGLRYLFANLGELQPRAVIAEFDINQRPLDIAEALLARNPKIIGVGVYIWNVAETTAVVSALKKIRPEIKIILGGPEVSHETEGQPLVALADHVITGEADLKFAEVCRELLRSNSEFQIPNSQLSKIIAAGLPDFSHLALPVLQLPGFLREKLSILVEKHKFQPEREIVIILGEVHRRFRGLPRKLIFIR